MKFKTKTYNNSIICAVELEKGYFSFEEILDENNTCHSIQGLTSLNHSSVLDLKEEDNFQLKDLNLPVSNEYLVTHTFNNDYLIICLTKLTDE